jgi:hypothetical protein
VFTAIEANLGAFSSSASSPSDRREAAILNASTSFFRYHEVAQPITLLRNLRPSVAAGAKVGVIDRNGNGENHGVAREVLIREANDAGYQLLEQDDFVKDGMDYFLVFGAK